MKHQLTKKSKGWLLAVLGGIVILVAVLLVLIPGKKPNESLTTGETPTATASNASGPTLLTLDMGDSDEFYKAPPEKKILLNFGDGRYDITNDVEMWMFGEPIVNLPNVLMKMGLTFTTEYPKGYRKIEGYEIYGPGENPDMSMRQPCFAMDDDGNYVVYTINSRQVRDQDGLQSSMMYPCTLTEDGTLLISAAYLPWCKDGELVGIGSAAFDYGESEIEITLEASERKAGYEDAEIGEKGEEEDGSVEEMAAE